MFLWRLEVNKEVGATWQALLFRAASWVIYPCLFPLSRTQVFRNKASTSVVPQSIEKMLEMNDLNFVLAPQGVLFPLQETAALG